MKEGIKGIVGKRIVGVMAKEAKMVGVQPVHSVFLLFDDGTHFELWGEIHGSGGIDRGGAEKVRNYLKDEMNLVLEHHESPAKATGQRIIINDFGRYCMGRVVETTGGEELQFGGLTVLKPTHRNNFELRGRNTGCFAYVDEADVPDTIRFMASRFRDFSDTITRIR